MYFLQGLLASLTLTPIMVAHAHMTMHTPEPYGSPNSSPLAADGSDFPCKGASNAGGKVTQMAIGAPQTMSFLGSAVHGGGSCQISLTKDNPATKSSKWMVIHSIEGGCPVKAAQAPAGGNFPADPDGTSSSTYDYTIPKGIEPGTYTLAWTWYNKIGNRELYMNCANIKVTGTARKREFHHNKPYSSVNLYERGTTFPDLFIANIAPSTCSFEEGHDGQFLDPGSSVDNFGVAGGLIGPNCSVGATGAAGSLFGAGKQSNAIAGLSSGSGSGSGAGAGTGSGTGSGTGAGSGSGSNAGATPAVVSPSPLGSLPPTAGNTKSSGAGADTTAAPPSGAPNVQAVAPLAASSGSSAASLPSAAPSGAAANTSSNAPSAGSDTSGNDSTLNTGSAGTTGPMASPGSSGAGGSSTPSSGAGAGSTSPSPGNTATSCSTPGQSICSPDGKQVGTCDQSLKVVMVPVPASTVCKNGLISWPRKRTYVGARRRINGRA